MSTESKAVIIRECSKAEGWEYAIDVANRQIREAEEKISELKLSIQTFEEMRAKGEPFPSKKRPNKNQWPPEQV